LHAGSPQQVGASHEPRPQPAQRKPPIIRQRRPIPHPPGPHAEAVQPRVVQAGAAHALQPTQLARAHRIRDMVLCMRQAKAGIRPLEHLSRQHVSQPHELGQALLAQPTIGLQTRSAHDGALSAQPELRLPNTRPRKATWRMSVAWPSIESGCTPNAALHGNSSRATAAAAKTRFIEKSPSLGPRARNFRRQRRPPRRKDRYRRKNSSFPHSPNEQYFPTARHNPNDRQKPRNR
jgi:hypothetical protein